MRVNIKLPNISEDDKSLIVVQLLELIEQQASTIQQQAEQIQLLKDEIARLKDASGVGPSQVFENMKITLKKLASN